MYRPAPSANLTLRLLFDAALILVFLWAVGAVQTSHASPVSLSEEQIEEYLSVLPGAIEEAWTEDNVMACWNAVENDGDQRALKALYELERAFFLAEEQMKEIELIVLSDLDRRTKFTRMNRIYTNERYRPLVGYGARYVQNVSYCNKLAGE